MRFSEAWLREYVNPPVTTAQLIHQLTMGGLEVDSAVPAAGEFDGVVVAEILETSSHPEADRLKVCRVDAGRGEPLQIVCGAPNARVGMKAPLALEGAVLPGGMKIKASKLRGIPSFGMLCSARELGVDEDASGLMDLPADAPVGVSLRDYLGLEDVLIEVDLTPNRADCLSIEGIAREVALLNGMDFRETPAGSVGTGSERAIPVSLEAPDACPRYLGRTISGISREAETPLWMKERLRRAGVRSLDAVVDVTNYVLLELGQPLHAFDADQLDGGIRVRYANPGETLRLLNEQELALQGDTLVIADQSRALALAGIMGGRDSAVSAATRNIFLECAFFTPELIMGKARRYGLGTDSSHRFERGVSFELQSRAMDRACELIVGIAGGVAGPLVESVSEANLPSRAPIVLREARIRRILGLDIPAERVSDMLVRLGMKPQRQPEGWLVMPPAFRFDIAIEADLIEELGRVHGYDHLPRRHPSIPTSMQSASEAVLELDRLKDLLVDRGYQEAITYSFVEEGTQQLIEPDLKPLALKNPISAEMGVMRTTLWTGLLGAAINNANRQQSRIRLFESGLRFIENEGGLNQSGALAILAMGPTHPEQWAEAVRPLDFHDFKADIEALVHLTGRGASLVFRAGQHPALHPGQTAEILLDADRVGWMGMLHPSLEKRLGFDQRVFLAQFDLEPLSGRAVPVFRKLSKFPHVRRDIAVVVDESVAVGSLMEAVRSVGGILRDVVVFDVYRGQGIGEGRKSVALGLLWQDDSETLVDARVDEALAGVLKRLAETFNAHLRD